MRLFARAVQFRLYAKRNLRKISTLSTYWKFSIVVQLCKILVKPYDIRSDGDDFVLLNDFLAEGKSTPANWWCLEILYYILTNRSVQLDHGRRLNWGKDFFFLFHLFFFSWNEKCFQFACLWVFTLRRNLHDPVGKIPTTTTTKTKKKKDF